VAQVKAWAIFLPMHNWNQIYQNNAAKLIGICRRYVKDADVAEDLVHDAFETAMHKVHQFDGKGKIEAWLYRIVIHKSLDYLKSQRSTTATDEVWNTLTDTPHDMNPTQSISKYEKVLQANLGPQDLLNVIDALPEHHRAVFNMYIIDGMGHHDIAQALQISIGTSKSHLFRARQKVQALLLERVEQQPAPEQKKKRRWLLLFWLFLGWGDHMLASHFRKTFADFAMAPQHPLVLPEGSLTTSSATTRRFQGGWVLFTAICLLLIGAWWRQKPTHQRAIKSVLPRATPKKTNLPTSNKTSITTPITLHPPQSNTPQQPLTVPKAQAASPNGAPTLQAITTTHTPKQDSAAPVRVVIKKIKVKRDTIYVEQHP